ncbi:hypothetical protein TNCV_1208171 [Trichonephila clavipes]|nr:hypothetical protein TNCV_1208171 [Trichonephila clavipes]
MAKLNHLDDFKRGGRIGKMKERRCFSVLDELEINNGMTLRYWKGFHTISTAVRIFGGGHLGKRTAQ